MMSPGSPYPSRTQFLLLCFLLAASPSILSQTNPDWVARYDGRSKGADDVRRRVFLDVGPRTWSPA